jgi:hypothetical protein
MRRIERLTAWPWNIVVLAVVVLIVWIFFSLVFLGTERLDDPVQRRHLPETLGGRG